MIWVNGTNKPGSHGDMSHVYIQHGGLAYQREQRAYECED